MAEAAAHEAAVLPTRTASRALWVLTLLVVLAFTLGRCAMAAMIDLRIDEAYYWTWSRESVVSYLDHPPMVAWFVRIGTMLFGDTPFGVRFAHLLAMPLIELVLADIVRRRTRSMTAALLVVLALESTISFGVVSAIVEPAIPQVLFSVLMLWALCRLEETGDGRWWLAFGSFSGLALLSKYTIVLFLPAVLAYVLVPRANRRWLLSPWLWAGAGLALAVFSPVLWWNWANDWASFRFQGVRASAAADGPNWETSSTYFLVNLLYNGPLLAIVAVFGSVVALWRNRLGADPVALATSVAFLAPFLYLAERTLYLYANPSWSIQIWPFGFAALAMAACPLLPGPRRRLRAWALASAVVGLVLPGALLFHATLGRSAWSGERDPIGGQAGFDTATEAILEVAKERGATWIATSTFHPFAILSWQLRNSSMPVIQVNERSRFIGWRRPDPATYRDQPALYVYRDVPDDLVTTTSGSRPLDDVQRIWRGVPVGVYHLQFIENWTPDLDPPRDSPFYRWPSLT